MAISTMSKYCCLLEHPDVDGAYIVGFIPAWLDHTHGFEITNYHVFIGLISEECERQNLHWKPCGDEDNDDIWIYWLGEVDDFADFIMKLKDVSEKMPFPPTYYHGVNPTDLLYVVKTHREIDGRMDDVYIVSEHPHHVPMACILTSDSDEFLETIKCQIRLGGWGYVQSDEVVLFFADHCYDDIIDQIFDITKSVNDEYESSDSDSSVDSGIE